MADVCEACGRQRAVANEYIATWNALMKTHLHFRFEGDRGYHDVDSARAEFRVHYAARCWLAEYGACGRGARGLAPWAIGREDWRPRPRWFETAAGLRAWIEGEAEKAEDAETCRAGRKTEEVDHG